MLDQITFKQKIAAIVVSAVVALVGFSLYSVVHTRSQLIESRQNELITAVQSVYNIAAGYKARADKSLFTIFEAKESRKPSGRTASWY